MGTPTGRFGTRRGNGHADGPVWLPTGECQADGPAWHPTGEWPPDGGPGRRQAMRQLRAVEELSCGSPQRMLTARLATSAMVSNETREPTAISTFAPADRGMVSVGLNAVALVNDT